MTSHESEKPLKNTWNTGVALLLPVTVLAGSPSNSILCLAPTAPFSSPCTRLTTCLKDQQWCSRNAPLTWTPCIFLGCTCIHETLSSPISHSYGSECLAESLWDPGSSVASKPFSLWTKWQDTHYTPVELLPSHWPAPPYTKSKALDAGHLCWRSTQISRFKYFPFLSFVIFSTLFSH